MSCVIHVSRSLNIFFLSFLLSFFCSLKISFGQYCHGDGKSYLFLPTQTAFQLQKKCCHEEHSRETTSSPTTVKMITQNAGYTV